MPTYAIVDEDGHVVNVIDAPDEGTAHACAQVHPANLRHGTKPGHHAHLIDGHPIGIHWHTSDNGTTWHDTRPMTAEQQADPDINPHPDITLER